MHEDLKKMIEEWERFEATALKAIVDHEQASGLQLWERLDRLNSNVRRLAAAKAELSKAAGMFPRPRR